MNLGESLTLRLAAIGDGGETWDVQSRSTTGVYVQIFIPDVAKREERLQRFAFAVGDAIEQCTRRAKK